MNDCASAGENQIRGCSLSRAIVAITPQHSQHLIIFVKKSVAIPDCKKQLRTSRLPKLILCGTKDHANKPAAKRLYKLSTNGRLLFIKNGKHELNREKPEIMAQAMRSFIENS